jgi:hypothetical protein
MIVDDGAGDDEPASPGVQRAPPVAGQPSHPSFYRPEFPRSGANPKGVTRLS